MKVVKGSVVKSLAGRDRDCHYVALEVSDRCVLVSDGKHHKMQAPKRKHVKHISPTGAVLEISGMTDKQLRKQLSAFLTRNGRDDPDQD